MASILPHLARVRDIGEHVLLTPMARGILHQCRYVLHGFLWLRQCRTVLQCMVHQVASGLLPNAVPLESASPSFLIKSCDWASLGDVGHLRHVMWTFAQSSKM